MWHIFIRFSVSRLATLKSMPSLFFFMKISVLIERTNDKQIITLPGKAQVKDLLAKLSLNPVTVLVTRNKTVVIEQTPLKDKDAVKILSVVSGG